MQKENGIDDLVARLHKAESENFEISKDVVGAAGAALVDEIVSLYRTLAAREVTSDLPEREEISITHFLMECPTRLVQAVLSIFRGHCGEGAVHTRRGIEAAGFVVAMRKDRSLFQTWLNASDDAASFRAYKNALNTREVLDKDSKDPLIVHLRKLYDHCSALMHPRVEAFAGKLRPADGSTAVAFHFFDVPPEGAPQIRKATAFSLEAHLAILRLLTSSFLSDLKLLEIGWPERMRELEVGVKLFRLNAESRTSQSGEPDEQRPPQGPIKA